MYKLLCILLINCWLQTPGFSYEDGPVSNSSVSLLCQDLEASTLDADLLFAEYSSKAAICLKAFLNRTHSIGNDQLDKIDMTVLTYGASNCRSRFALQLKNIRHQAHVEAEYNAENHQKYFLAHMIVQRMHLNKTSVFIKRAEGGLRTCSSSCHDPVMQKKLFRWQKSARYQLDRANKDIEHAELAYRDLLTHASKRYGRIEKKANTQIQQAVSELYQCTNRV